MTKETIERLKRELSVSPIMAAKSCPTPVEIKEASRTLGVAFSSDFIDFLTHIGGAMAGAYPLFGLRPVEVMEDHRWSVVQVTKEYRNQLEEVADWVIFSEDHAGNPIGFDSSGVVWIHDHDFGGVSKIAEDVESYIRRRCLKLT